jgi:NAD(P)-dependent dehydrogenase (short-subunit alcohol dehydrogenase family)
MLTTIWPQVFPPKPQFTEENVTPGSQVGKVFLVTGANQGVGFELVKMLYPSGATIYLAGRSQQRVEAAIEQVESTSPTPKTPARLKFLHLDLADLMTIKQSVAEFASQESKLDILWNNAGIGGVPAGVTTRQNIEGYVGINCVAPLLFTQCLLPFLKAAARTAPEGSVRITWTASLMVETLSPRGGVSYDRMSQSSSTDPEPDYASSKAGNWFLADEAAKRWGKDGIVSVAVNPGNLYTQMAKGAMSKLKLTFAKLMLYDPKFGAYTNLYAGFSTELTLENNGSYVWPFGRLGFVSRSDLHGVIADGGARRFWEWCEKRYQPFAAA